MFPMRDHLYELAKAQEIELMEKARREEQLAQARNYNYETWTWEPMRRWWQKFFGPTPQDMSRQNRARQNGARADVAQDDAMRDGAMRDCGAPPGIAAA